jgi:hypothetical protein
MSDLSLFDYIFLTFWGIGFTITLVVTVLLGVLLVMGIVENVRND